MPAFSPSSSALPALLLALLGLPGCVSEGRVTAFTPESMPIATASQIAVRVTATERAPGSLILRLSIVNSTNEPVVFARKYGAFTAATVTYGDQHVTGTRVPAQSRTFPPNQYTVLAGEDANLGLDFRAAGIDQASHLSLQIQGSTHGVDQVWTIAIPPEPSGQPNTANSP
jgi:hypothetical protein